MSVNIAKQIKNLSLQDAIKDFEELKNIATHYSPTSTKISDRCRTGNNIVDYFTFEERLNTRGKYNVNFYEFLDRIDEFREKKFIQNMLIYYENVKNKNKTKNQYIVYKEVYNICISAINIFRPLVAIEIYAKYNPMCILDPCAGWGGRGIGAAALNVPRYIGIDVNTNLRDAYNELGDFLEERSTTTIDMRFEDAITTNYAALPKYDMVFTSPPYYFLEKYSNNPSYTNKKEMDELFYKPLILQSYEYLQEGGVFILNVNKEIYKNVCVKLLGDAEEKIPLKKSKRQNEYAENIYVWHKTNETLLFVAHSKNN